MRRGIDGSDSSARQRLQRIEMGRRDLVEARAIRKLGVARRQLDERALVRRAAAPESCTRRSARVDSHSSIASTSSISTGRLILGAGGTHLVELAETLA
jgi:hypothetical protein